METIVTHLEENLVYLNAGTIIKDLLKGNIWAVSLERKDALVLEHRQAHGEQPLPDWVLSFDSLIALFSEKDDVLGKHRLFIRGFSSYGADGVLAQDAPKLKLAILNTKKKLELEEAQAEINRKNNELIQKETRLSELEQKENLRSRKREQRKESFKKHSEEYESEQQKKAELARQQAERQKKISTASQKAKAQQQRFRLYSLD